MNFLGHFLLTALFWFQGGTFLVGYNTVAGTGLNLLGPDCYWSGPYTAAASGTVNAIFFNAAGNLTGFNVTMGIAADSSSLPGATLGTTVGGDAGVAGWKSQALITPVSVTSGTKYWLMFATPTGIAPALLRDSTIGVNAYYAGITYASGTLPANATGSSIYVTDYSISIYGANAVVTASCKKTLALLGVGC